MIVLDTNVVSALMRKDADPMVTAWLDRQPAESVWITAVTVFEVHFGLELLPPGRRRRRLEDAFARALDEDFEGRVLPLRAACRAAGGIDCGPRTEGGARGGDPGRPDRRNRELPARDPRDPEYPALRGPGHHPYRPVGRELRRSTS
jgi:toxin FitB